MKKPFCVDTFIEGFYETKGYHVLEKLISSHLKTFVEGADKTFSHAMLQDC